MPFKRISGLISKIQMIRDTKQFRKPQEILEDPASLNPVLDSSEVCDESSQRVTLTFDPKDFKETWSVSNSIAVESAEALSDFSYSVSETHYESSESEFAPLTRQRACSNVALAINVKSSVDHKALVVEPTRKAEITNEEELGVKLRVCNLNRSTNHKG